MNSMILGRYVPGNSILHRMDPRAKLLGLFLLIVILFWANNVLTNALLFLLAFALILSAKIPFRFFINGLKSMVFIIAFTTLFQLFATTGGKTLFQFYFLFVTAGVFTSLLFWLILILVYYFIATFISIDAVIGKIYPIFGICLIIMAIGVIFGIFTNPAYTIPEIWDHFGSMHPSGTPIWSFMFITVACGAISGFHSTQSPLMARCMKSEKQGHFVFYGAMVCEGVIALIWAAAGCSLYEVTGGLNTGLAQALAMGQSKAIYDVCSKTMGGVGIALAMVGVVVCPITSGDTAFRSARLTLADWFKIDQDGYANRLKLCIPVLGVGAFLGIGNALGFINYTVIWRYFSWTNQTLAMIVLWAASMYLFKEKKNYWITAVPATFMSAVSCTYFVLAPECLGGLLNSKTAEGATIYNTAVAYPVGIVFAAAMLALFIHATKKAGVRKAA